MLRPYVNVVTRLHVAGVGGKLVLGQQQVVAHSQFATALPSKQTAPCAHIDDGILWCALRLSLEEIGHSRNGVKLERLVGVELKFHVLFQHPTAMRFDCLMHRIWSEIEFSRPFHKPMVAPHLRKQIRIFERFENTVEKRVPKFHFTAESIRKTYGKTQMA
jgi:hypothetical protein